MKPLVLYVESDAPSFLLHRMGTADAMRRLGCDVHLAAPQAPERAEIERLGFTFHPVPFARGSISPIRDGTTCGALYALYRALEPDLVHHVALKAVLYGTVAARLVGVPAIVNGVTGLGYLFSEGNARAALLRRVFVTLARPVLSRGNICTSFENGDDLALFQRLRLIASGRGYLIHGTGVDTQVYRPTPEAIGTPVVTLASRMLWDKGVGVFADAARILRERGVAVRCALVGTPDPENPNSVPTDRLRRWHEQGIVEWWGFRPDMPRVYEETHIFALPTMYREGVPRVLIEAAASGRPAITTDRPGCRDIVRDGENGLLVACNDAAALANAIATLVSDSGLRARMGARGRAIVEAEFAQEHVVAATLAMYSRLMPAFPRVQSAA